MKIAQVLWIGCWLNSTVIDEDSTRIASWWVLRPLWMNSGSCCPGKKLCDEEDEENRMNRWPWCGPWTVNGGGWRLSYLLRHRMVTHDLHEVIRWSHWALIRQQYVIYEANRLFWSDNALGFMTPLNLWFTSNDFVSSLLYHFHPKQRTKGACCREPIGDRSQSRRSPEPTFKTSSQTITRHRRNRQDQ